MSYSDYETLSKDERKSVRDLVKQKYLAYLFINNSNQKLHSQLKIYVANNHSKGNAEEYPSNIHKALTLMNEYKLLKLDVSPVPAQGTAFATTSHRGKGKKGFSGNTKYISDADWKAMSPEAQRPKSLMLAIRWQVTMR